MDKKGLFRYFPKVVAQTTQTADTISKQTMESANNINEGSTVSKSVAQAQPSQDTFTNEHFLPQITDSIPNDLGTLAEGPRQPKRESFPFTVFGTVKRAFRSQYYNEFPFIEYSVSTDSIFCFYCRHFSSNIGNSEDSFIKRGFRNWKHIGDKLTKHLSSNEHSKCMEKWNNYTQTLTSGSVSSILSTAHKKEISENRIYIDKLFTMLIYLTTQGLALRGHDESKKSSNKGNFLELCHMFAKFDQTFSEKFDSTFSLTSHQLQNEMLETISIVFQKHILMEIQKSGFYCLLADDARSHKNEYVSICVRYVNELKIYERFIGFENVSESQSAKSLYEVIKSKLQKFGIYNMPIIAVL